MSSWRKETGSRFDFDGKGLSRNETERGNKQSREEIRKNGSRDVMISAPFLFGYMPVSSPP
jgi:hypothetical protein